MLTFREAPRGLGRTGRDSSEASGILLARNRNYYGMVVLPIFRKTLTARDIYCQQFLSL